VSLVIVERTCVPQGLLETFGELGEALADVLVDPVNQLLRNWVEGVRGQVGTTYLQTNKRLLVYPIVIGTVMSPEQTPQSLLPTWLLLPKSLSRDLVSMSRHNCFQMASYYSHYCLRRLSRCHWRYYRCCSRRCCCHHRCHHSGKHFPRCCLRFQVRGAALNRPPRYRHRFQVI
jgi:hypothetical protein